MSEPLTASENGDAAPEQEGVQARQASAFVLLLKPRVMSLVVFTALIGMLIAPVQDPSPLFPFIGVTALICIAMGAGASGALNMWYERDIDAIMKRTRMRPLPRGTVEPDDALTWGLFLSVVSVLAMALFVNSTAALLLALTIFYYVVIYTMWLKRRTPQNIVIGGAAGAFPPMIGWAAMTGRVDIEPIVLFLIIFMWTPPHFWALSLTRAGDYHKAGIPMLPVVAGEAETRAQILIYTVLLVPLTLLPSLMGFAGVVYTAAAVVLGLTFFVLALGIWWGGRVAGEDRSRQTGVKHQARRLFAFSIFYLFILFLLLGAERVIGIGMLPDRLGVKDPFG